MRALRRTVLTSGRTDRGQRQRTSQCLHLPPRIYTALSSWKMKKKRKARGGGQQTTTNNKCCEHKPVRSWDERKRVLCRGISPNAYNQQGRGDKGNDNRECPFENGIIQAQKNGCGTFVAVAPTLLSSDYKQPPLVIEKRKEQDNGKSQQPGLPNGA